MTVPSEQSRIQYTTDGTSVSFPVPFRFLNATHLQVARQHNDEASILELGVDYSVSGDGNQAGGLITTTTALPSGDTLSIERVVPITQETAYQRNDPFPERAHEQALDKLTMIAQMLGSVLGLTPGSTNRALLLGAADTDGSGSYRAHNNRVQDVGDAVEMRDAINKKVLLERLSGLSVDGSGQYVVERLADTSVPENGAGMVGFRRSVLGTIIQSLADIASNNAISASEFGIKADNLTDNTERFNFALIACRLLKKNLYLPHGETGIYLISDYLLQPGGVSIFGEGKRDLWNTNSTFTGTTIKTLGAGTPRKWTDINDSDQGLETPMIVAGGNGCFLRDITLETDGSSGTPWSIGWFLPCVKQCGFQSLQSTGGFTNSPLYIDLTWSDRNEKLKALHPQVETSTGANEFNGNDFFLIGSGPGIKIKGTDRNPSNYTAETWLWGWGGGSDTVFSGGRCTGLEVDAALINSGNAVQGIRMYGVNYRVGNRPEMMRFGRANRIEMFGCYGEGSSDGTRRQVHITSNTGSISIQGRIINAEVYKDGIATGALLGNSSPDLPDNFTFHRDNGNSIYPGSHILTTGIFPKSTLTKSLGSSSLNWLNLRVQNVISDDGELTLRGSGGIAFRTGGSTNNRMQLRSDRFIVSPDGTTSRLEVRDDAVVFGESLIPATDNSISIGSGSLRPSQVFAVNGTINTSDAREKTTPLQIDDTILDAWGDVELITYQWLHALDDKGDLARWHFGVIAQQVRDVFASHGLDGTKYGLLCYDEWGDEYAPIMAKREVERLTLEPNGYDEHGEEVFKAVIEKDTEDYDTGEVQLVKPAGNRWGIRADQCLFLEAAYQRRRFAKLETRLQALEDQ